MLCDLSVFLTSNSDEKQLKPENRTGSFWQLNPQGLPNASVKPMRFHSRFSIWAKMENYLRERAIAENSQFALMDFPFESWHLSKPISIFCSCKTISVYCKSLSDRSMCTKGKIGESLLNIFLGSVWMPACHVHSALRCASANPRPLRSRLLCLFFSDLSTSKSRELLRFSGKFHRECRNNLETLLRAE